MLNDSCFNDSFSQFKSIFINFNVLIDFLEGLGRRGLQELLILSVTCFYMFNYLADVLMKIIPFTGI